MKASAESDEALVERIGRGDASAVSMLLARKLPRVLALAGRMLGDRIEAEDVAQDVFIRVWRQAPNWRPGEARFDTWIHRVALNLCYDRLRRRREHLTAEPPEQVDPGPGPDRGLVARETGQAVASAMAGLPDRQREAIVLCHYQDFSNIEAAAAMGISIEALESLLARGRRALRLALAGQV
jgi:RNA polymerase sigma-70 factor (ECF subfamily)